MAKKVSEAPVVEKTTSERIAELKAQMSVLKEEEARVKADAKAEVEAKYAESKAAIDGADQDLGDEIWSLIKGLKNRSVVLGQSVNVITVVNAIGDEDACKRLLELREARNALGHVARVSSGPRGPRTNTGELKKAQVKMMIHLLDHEPCTRQQLCEIGTGRTGDASQLNGSFVGNANADTRDPFSLWGRGWISEEEVTVDGHAKRMFSLTKDGKVKAKELTEANGKA
jgi:hypothetical protein